MITIMINKQRTVTWTLNQTRVSMESSLPNKCDDDERSKLFLFQGQNKLSSVGP